MVGVSSVEELNGIGIGIGIGHGAFMIQSHRSQRIQNPVSSIQTSEKMQIHENDKAMDQNV